MRQQNYATELACIVPAAGLFFYTSCFQVLLSIEADASNVLDQKKSTFSHLLPESFTIMSTKQ